MKLKRPGYFVLLALFAILVTSCTGALFTPAPTLDPACTARKQLSSETYYLDFEPDCRCIQQSRIGMTWNGLTIGSSTIRDVQNTLDVEGWIKPESSEWYFEEPVTAPSFPSWDRVRACFNNDVLSTLYVTAAEQPKTIEGLVEKFGEPDRVTWGPGYEYRVLIWSERGMMVEWALYDDVPVWLYLFPPLPADQIDGSWLMAALPGKLLGVQVDDLPTITALENPWGLGREK